MKQKGDSVYTEFKEIKNGNETNTEETKFLDSGTEVKSQGPKYGKRHGQMIGFFGLLLVSFGVKVSINIALVAMTDQTNIINSTIPTYNWTDKNIIISAFFWGYILPQIGAGWLATHYGPKWFLVVTMTVSSLCGLLIPTFAAYFGSQGVMVCRALQGFCQGFVIPSMHTLLAQWIPQSERSMVSSVVYAGTPCGTAIALVLTGYISASSYGWPMSFYFFNGLGLTWAICFAMFGYNKPADHPTITKDERAFIENSLGGHVNQEKISTPWIPILSSYPMWALLLAQCGFTWGFWTLLSEIPLYMDKVMMFNLKSNSLLSSLPYIFQWFFMVSCGYVSDQLLTRKILSIGSIRRLMNSLAFLIPAISLLILGNSGPENATKALVLLVIAVGMGSFALNGFYINHIDLSPNHAGVIMGICNFVASIAAIVAPLLVQYLVTDEHDPNQWKVVFYFAAAVYVVTNFIFVFFGSTNVQPWNNLDSSKGVDKA